MKAWIILGMFYSFLYQIMFFATWCICGQATQYYLYPLLVGQYFSAKFKVNMVFMESVRPLVTNKGL